MAGDIKKKQEKSQRVTSEFHLKLAMRLTYQLFLTHASYLIFHIPELLFNWLLLLKRIQQHKIDKD